MPPSFEKNAVSNAGTKIDATAAQQTQDAPTIMGRGDKAKPLTTMPTVARPTIPGASPGGEGREVKLASNGGVQIQVAEAIGGPNTPGVQQKQKTGGELFVTPEIKEPEESPMRTTAFPGRGQQQTIVKIQEPELQAGERDPDTVASIKTPERDLHEIPGQGKVAVEMPAKGVRIMVRPAREEVQVGTDTPAPVVSDAIYTDEPAHVYTARPGTGGHTGIIVRAASDEEPNPPAPGATASVHAEELTDGEPAAPRTTAPALPAPQDQRRPISADRDGGQDVVVLRDIALPPQVAHSGPDQTLPSLDRTQADISFTASTKTGPAPTSGLDLVNAQVQGSGAAQANTQAQGALETQAGMGVPPPSGGEPPLLGTPEPDGRGAPGPNSAYTRLRNHLITAIASGDLPPGVPIAWDAVSAAAGVHVNSKLRRPLVDEGIIVTVRGVGSFPGNEAPADAKPRPPGRKSIQQERIIAEVREGIASGEFPPGVPIVLHTLPSATEVHPRTVARARAKLVGAGDIVTVRGVGSFPGNEAPADAKSRPPRRVSRRQNNVMSYVREGIALGEIPPGVPINWIAVVSATGEHPAIVSKAQAKLARAGDIVTVRGVGSFPGNEAPAAAKPRPSKRASVQLLDRPIGEALVVDSRESLQEILSFAAIGNLLAAFGNGEGKAFLIARMYYDTLAHMHRQGYTQAALQALMLRDQRGDAWTSMSDATPVSWCENSLLPIGLVVKEEIGPEGQVFYGLSDYGATTGVALAGWLLSYSEQHPKISLLQLNGSTSSTSPQRHEEMSGIEYRVRAPLTNLRILYELTRYQSNTNIRKQELVAALLEQYPADYPDRIEFASRMKEHLARLQRAGILTYETRPYGQNFVSYKVKAERPTGTPPKSRYAGKTTLIGEIYDIFVQNGEASMDRETLFQKLVERNPAILARIERGELNRQTYFRRISSLVGRLARWGYIEYDGFNNTEQAVVLMTDPQRQALIEYVRLIEAFRKRSSDPEFLKEGSRRAERISQDPEVYSDLLKKARVNSPEANQVPRAETARRLLEYIRANPRTTARDMRIHLNTDPDYMQLIGYTPISTILRTLEQNNLVSSQRLRGRLKGYSIQIDEDRENETVIQLFSN